LSKYYNLFNSDNDNENSLKNKIEQKDLLTNFLIEDIGTGDITSNILIDETMESNAQIICKNDGNIIVSGLEEAKSIFEICNCNCTLLNNDGDIIKKNKTIVMEIQGSAKSILKAERTALNLIMHMSGISTKTHQFIKEIGEYSKFVSISSTRKTAPGLRQFDKKSVILGGGISHRRRLDQLILIKDNHISIIGSVSKAVSMAKSKFGSNRKIECEVNDYQGILDAIKAGADIIMLDNFTPQLVKKSIEQIKEQRLRDKIVIEVSGGITLDNINQYASSKPDIISIGSLTHSFQAIDFSLEIV
jgi:nicotinate-nucleotide pyrophosphorylase (carboxylating)